MITKFRKQFIEMVVNTIRSLRLVWESSKKWTIFAIAIALVQGVTPLIVISLVGRIIDTVTEVAKGTVGFEAVSPLLVLVAGVAFVDVALSSIASLVREAQILTVTDHVVKAIHQKSIAVDLEYYENSQYYDSLHRAQQEAPSRPPQIVDNLLSTVQNIVLMVGIVGLLLTLNPLTPLILVVSALPIAFIRFYYVRVNYEWQRRIAETERRTNYYNWLITAEWHAKEVRLFRTGDTFAKRYNLLRDRLRAERMGLTARRTRAELLTQFVMVVALFSAFGLVIRDVLINALSIGQLVIAFQAFQRGQSALRSLLGSLASLYEHNLFLKDFYVFLGLKNRLLAPEQPLPVPAAMEQGICFENVSFRYSQGERDILKGINFTIKPGEIVALVGENGAGKTTLIKLMCRLYDPTEGRITLDGKDLREYDPADVRRIITALFQDFNIYQLSAAENIWIGNTDQALEASAVTAAAKQSGADEVIQRLPQGYDTPLGMLFEGGQELSVGQWQKVALARAFFRNAQLIILDEPTSALDVMTEHEIFQRIREIVASRSAILISHRLSTVQMADRIIVLDQGKIIEDGTHTELMALDGHYALLYRTQAQYYR